MFELLLATLLIGAHVCAADFTWPDTFPTSGFREPLFDSKGKILVAFDRTSIQVVDLVHRKVLLSEKSAPYSRPVISGSSRQVAFVAQEEGGDYFVKYDIQADSSVQIAKAKVDLKGHSMIGEYAMTDSGSMSVVEVRNHGGSDETWYPINGLAVMDSSLKELNYITGNFYSFKILPEKTWPQCPDSCLMTTEYRWLDYEHGLKTMLRVRSLPDLKIIEEHTLYQKNPGRHYRVSGVSASGGTVGFYNQCGTSWARHYCVTMMDTKTWKENVSFTPSRFTGAFLNGRISTNGDLLAFSDDVARFVLFRGKTAVFDRPLSGKDADRIVDFTFTRSDQNVVALHLDGRILVLDAKTGKVVLEREIPKTMSAMTVSANGKTMYTINESGQVQEWDL